MPSDLWMVDLGGAYRNPFRGWVFVSNELGWRPLEALHSGRYHDDTGTGFHTDWHKIKDLAPPVLTPPTPVASASANWQFSASWAVPNSAYPIRIEVWSVDGAYATTLVAAAGSTALPYALYLPEWGQRLVHCRIQYYNGAGAGPWSGWSNQVTLTSGQDT